MITVLQVKKKTLYPLFLLEKNIYTDHIFLETEVEITVSFVSKQKLASIIIFVSERVISFGYRSLIICGFVNRFFSEMLCNDYQ